jgi:hypothetical protein
MVEREAWEYLRISATYHAGATDADTYWEYDAGGKIYRQSADLNIETLANRFGAEGWELVHIDRNLEIWTVYPQAAQPGGPGLPDVTRFLGGPLGAVAAVATAQPKQTAPPPGPVIRGGTTRIDYWFRRRKAR